MKRIISIKKIAIIGLIAVQAIAVQAQDNYTLDSVAIQQNNSNSNSNSKYEKQPSKRAGTNRGFWKAIRTLFGFNVMTSYSYQHDLYGYGDMMTGEVGQSREAEIKAKTKLAVDNITFNDGLVAIGLMTPIINYKQTFSFNYFSNDNLNNKKYEKRHIDFLGLSRLGYYLDKFNNNHSIAERFTKLKKWLPIYDHKLIKTSSYTFDEMKISGNLYNIMSYTRTKIHNSGASYKINETTYNNFTVDLTYNNLSMIDTRSVINYIVLSTFTNGLSSHASLGEIEEVKGLLPIFGKYPMIYVNVSLFPNANISITDKNGNTLYSDSSSSLITMDLGITYTRPIFIPRAHLVIVPDFTWQFFTYSLGEIMHHPYFHAGVGLQYYF
jgi:hypothetical protein